jgi:hypothetical protein
MDKDSAKNLIQVALQNSFNKEKFIYLAKNILNHIEEASFVYKGNFIFDDFADSIKTVERIGKYKDPEGKLIDILIVQLQRETSLERARTKQRNFVAKYLKGSRGGVLKDAALAAFVSPNGDDWRFSLVKMEYKFNEKGKVEEEFTPARRYSFLVGKNENSHTAQSRLLPLLLNDETNPSLEELEDVFSVEKVTKEFFEKYRALFLRLKESLDEIVKRNPKVNDDFKEKNVDTVDFAKKLLGQIVFLYFLQKKGWFGVPRGKDWGEGDKKFLRNLFDNAKKENKNYFNRFLEPLFYEALRLERPKDYYDQFNCRIPFLNGGLFDPINDYDWQDTDIEIPNDIFSNNRKTKEGDTGDGILDIFDRYNFTVKEDEPLEKEVAVDPEMLGKVFENLLEVKDRKSKGTYYTPREIVHYMCQESLANYLSTELEGKVCKEEIETLIKYGESVIEHDSRVVNEGRETVRYAFKLPQSVRQYAKLIDEKLASIRVCDPAVGSGAFPVGMMNEIVRTRLALNPYLGNGSERTPYHFKREAIQNCLYGVDIDPGAVEIAKLRLWLSLIVDEEDREKIQPLPNLDYKIMQGNSLLSEFMGIDFDKEDDNKNGQLLISQDDTGILIEELKSKKDEYLNKASAGEKQKLKQEIEDLMVTIFETKLQKQKSDYFNMIKSIEEKYKILPNKEQREKLIQQEKEKLYKDSGFNLEQFEKQLREYTTGNKIRPFFPWRLYFAEVFHEKKGFDVVIANPPYVNVEKIDDSIKKSIHSFKTAYQKYDLYVLFYEKSISLLKNSGNLMFISSNKFLSQGYGFLLRQYLLKFEIKTIINFNFNVFESAIVRTCIFQLIKKEPQNNKIRIIDVSGINDKYKFLEEKYSYIDQEIFEGTEENNFRINLTREKVKLLNKIKNDCLRVENICSVNYGLRPSSEKINQKKDYFIKNTNSTGTYKRYFEGKDTGRWRVKKSYFIDYRPDVMYNPMFIELFENEKLVGLRTLSDIEKLRFIYDDEGLFCNDSVVIVTPWYLFKDVDYLTIKRNITKEKINNSQRYSIKYLQAILNSKLIKFYVNELLYDGTHFYPDHMKSLPIKISDEKQQKPFIDLVDKILAITKDDDYLENSAKQAKVRENEKQIDQLVYKLYGLTDEEIKIVEGQNDDSKS